MAKKRSGVNKSQEIKKALAATPERGPKQIAEDLKALGVDVTPAHVSTVKTNMKAESAGTKKTATKASKKAVGQKALAPKARSAKDITFQQLQQAKELSRQLGGLEKAKEALSALSQLRE